MPVRFHLRPSIRRVLYTGHMTLGTDIDPLLPKRFARYEAEERNAGAYVS